MATHKVISEYIPYTKKEFAVFISDTKEEAESLDTDYSAGSYVIIPGTGDDGGVLMLNASAEWKEL